MKRRKWLFAASLCLVALSCVPAANAQVNVRFLGAGSSAMWQSFALAAKNLAGAGAHHYTVKGNCTSGPCAYIDDSQRSSFIPNESGSLWVVWDSTQTNVWAYIAVDSVVGNRAFYATPRATLDVDANTLSGVPAGQTNLIPAVLWGLDDPTLPDAIYNALNLTAVTAGLTDIRPEDAYFASVRAISPLNATDYSGLGYGLGPGTLIGDAITSSFTTAGATPVEFSLDGGADPFTSFAVPPSTTIPVGAAPVLFLINKTNRSGLGAVDARGNPIFNNIATRDVSQLFNGTQCDSDAFNALGAPPTVPVHVMLREPLSGTMNTTEFTTLRLAATPANSQEVGVDPTVDNPLNQSCVTGGDRRRGIGTGEVVNNGVRQTADSIAYAFFGYGNVSSIAGSTNYAYLKVDGVDPINNTYSDGRLPTCVAPCPVAPGSSFPHLRDGTYRSWSVLRVVTDASGPNLTNARALVAGAQANINSTVPDFVPAVAAGGDPGLRLYRSHYAQAGRAPNNGLGGQTESGGDMGGCIEPVGPPPGILGCRQ